MSDDKGISVASLSPEQLTNLKQTIENDISSFERAFEALRSARAKFGETKRSLDGLTKQSSGTPLMVPLTTSLYIPGKLTEADKVIVDLGTGYFARVSVAYAVGYYTRKCEMLQKQMDKIADTANLKVRQKDQVTQVLQRKISMMQQVQQQ